MTVILLDRTTASVELIEVDTIEDAWDYFNESRCSWMEVHDVTDILNTVNAFIADKA